MSKKILFCFLLFQTMLFGQQEWRSIGPDDYEQLSLNDSPNYNPIALDSNNIPYVVYDTLNYDNTQIAITVRRFVDGYWENVGQPQIFTNPISQIDIAIDANDVPYVVFTKNNTSGSTTVTRYNGTAWENIGNITPASFSTKLAFNSQNELHLVGSFGSTSKAGVKKFTGSSWVAVGSIDASPNAVKNTSISFDTNDVPYIAYSDLSSNGKIRVRKLNAGQWENVGSPFSGGDTEYVTVKVDSNNIPYAAFKDVNSSIERAVVKKFNGTTWENVGSTVVSSGEAFDVSFIIDGNNAPIVAYRDYNTSFSNVKLFNGTSWISVGTPFYGIYSKIAADNNNVLYVSYNNGNVFGVKKFNGSLWEMMGPTDISNGTIRSGSGRRSFMDMSPDGSIYIAYLNELTDKAEVKKWNGWDWELVGQTSLQESNLNSVEFKFTGNAPYIVLRLANGNATLKKFNGTNWETVITSGGLLADDFVVDNNNNIYTIAGLTSVVVKKRTGTTWTTLGTWTSGSTLAFNRIVIGNDNLPCVMYDDETSIGIIKKLNASGSGWQTLGNLSTGAARDPYIKLNTQGDIYVMHTNLIGNNYFGLDLQKVENNSLQFVGSLVPSSELINMFDFALDHNNIPFVIYRSTATQDRNSVRKWENESSVVVGETMVSASRGYFYPSIRFDNDNNPVISTNGQGIFAKYFGEVNPAYRIALDFINLQGPASLTIDQGQNGTIYARTNEPGITETDGGSEHVTSWIGISSENTHPSTWTNWIPASYNGYVENNDEYLASIGSTLTPGTYYYTSRFKLDNGPYTYGGYSAEGGGYWDGISNVSGILTINCTASAPSLAPEQTLCSGATLADINTENADVVWYSSPDSTTPLNEATILSNGQYFASQISGECESTGRTPVSVSIHVTAAPGVSTSQNFCGSHSVSSLSANGASLKWYDVQTGGEQLDTAVSLVTGNYYVSQTLNGCESPRVLVEVTINITPVPSVTQSTQTFCNSGLISDLEVEGDNVLWYTSSSEGTEITGNTTLFNNTIYYASQTINGCESSERIPVMVIINDVASPQGTNVQQINVDVISDATLEDIILTGITGVVNWYLTMEDALGGDNSVPITTQLTSGSTYYATQTINGCTSESVFSVTADVVLGNKVFNNSLVTVYPNPAIDFITIAAPIEITSVKVFNLLGQQLMSTDAISREIKLDISALSKGNYLLYIKAGNGTEAFKIIKQ